MEEPLTRRADAATAAAILDQHRREQQPRTVADRASVALLGGGFVLVAAVGLWRAAEDVGPSAAVLAAGLVAVYAFAVRTEFRAVTGSAVPTQPVLVVMLLLLPPLLVPALVLAGFQLGGRRDDAGGGPVNRFFVRALSGWHCVGPVAVLVAFDVPQAVRGVWPASWVVLLLALAAQVALDAVTAVLRCLALGAPLADLRVPLTWTFAVDALLAPLGACVAVAAGPGPLAAVLVACPVVLMHLVSLDRARRLDEAVSLSVAYDSVLGLAIVDPLTGLLNRRGWDEALGEASRQLEHDPAVDVIVVLGDVDHLKATNDAHGHAVGDGLLGRAAEALRDAGGPDAVVARLGGDEFGVLVVTGASGPPLDGEGLRLRVAAHVGDSDPVAGVRLSVSLGVASARASGGLAAACESADAAARADKLARAADRRPR